MNVYTIDYTLAKMVNLMLSVFYHNKNTGRQQTPRTPRWRQLYQWWRRNSWMIKQGNAKLDTEAGFRPYWHCWSVSKLLMVHNQCVNVKKGSALEFLCCWQLPCFSTTTFLTRNSNRGGYASTTEEAQCGKAQSAFLTTAFVPGTAPQGPQALLKPFIS